MRLLIAAPLLGFALLGGCAPPQILYSERVDPTAPAAPCDPNASTPQRIALHIVNGFSAEEEAKIIAAVRDWNRRGKVRFEVAALNYDTVEPGAWSIVKLDEAVDGSPGDQRLEPVAVTRRISAGGGSIVVDVSRLGVRDLRVVIAAELGAAVGGGDGPVSARVTSAAR